MKTRLNTIRNLMLKSLSIGLTSLVLSVTSLNAQTTVLIDPAGDGGFENGTTLAANGWTDVNGTNTNKWNIGTAGTPTAGTKAAYISNDLGVTNAYTNNAQCRVHLYRDVTFPAGETIIKLSFKWKGQGESNFDYLTVVTMPTSVTPAVNSPTGAGSGNWSAISTTYSGAAIVSTPSNLNLQSTAQTQTIYLPSSFAGTTQRLVFMWSNDNGGGNQAPALIDEISLTSRMQLNTTSVNSGNWSSPATWSGNEMPAPNDIITISTGNLVTIDTALTFVIDDVTVNGTLNFSSAIAAFSFNNIATNPGGLFNVFNGTTGKTINVGGNISNNGSIDLSVTGAKLVLNGAKTQTVGGTGTVVSNTIQSLSFANTATIPTISWSWSNINVANTLSFISGYVGLGMGNSMTLGTSGSVLGTLTWTAGGFTSGKFARWIGTSGAGTTITAGTNPSFSVGSFPFISGSLAMGFPNKHFHKATSVLTTAGTFAVAFDSTSGTTNLGASVTESGLTIDKQTLGSWTVSTGNGYASSATHSFAVQGTNMYKAISTNARLLIGGALVGTHQKGSVLPLAERISVPAASISGIYTIGIAAGELPTFSVTSGAWDDPLTWSNGVPSCSQSAIINAADSIWIDAGTTAANTTAMILEGKLTITGSSLTIGCTNKSNLAQVNGKLYVLGGMLNVNGNIAMALNSIFWHTGGNINIDGNAAGVLANSVADGTPIVSIATGNIKLSGGIFTVIDPHAGVTNAAGNRAFYYTGGTAIDVTTGWALKFGDGVSADAGGAVATPVGFVMEIAGSKIVIDSLIIDAGLTGTNRFVTLNNSTTVGCNTMYITANGEARISSATHISGNLTNNGILTNTGGAVTFGTFLNGTAGATSKVQVISGSGIFRNLVTSPTANFTTLTINNTNPAGVTFAGANTLLSGSNTGTVSGTFTLTKGIVNTGSNTFVLGVSASTPGTLTYTNGNGGFGAGSTFSRWWGTAVAGQTITAGAIPTAGAGSYPFATIQLASPLTYNNRSVYIVQAAIATAGGTIAVKHNDATGLITASITDGSYTVNNTTNANWQVSTTGITGTPTYTLALSGEGLYTGTNGSSRIVFANAPLGGTHQNGTLLPNAQRITVPLANLTNTWYLGANNNDIASGSVASGAWEDAAIWSKGVVPTCSDSVVINNGHTVTVNTMIATARAIAINTFGQLTVSGSALTVGCTMNNSSVRVSGKLAITAGTVAINGALINNPSGRIHQSGGNIIIDGNDNGIAASSVTNHLVDMYATTDSSVVFAGGTFTIVDPAVANAGVAFKVFPSQPVNISTNHTLIFGNGISAAPGGTNGFQVNLFNTGAGIVMLGNVIVNTNSSGAVNRFVTTTNNIGILGNLTVTNGSYRMASPHYVKGDIVNNDSLINTSTLNLADYTSATVKANNRAQSITGTGKFLNSATAPTAGMASLTVNNNSAAGVTLGTKISVSGTLTLTRGIVNTNATDSFRLGTATVSGTLAGAHDSAYINGPFYRTFAVSRNASGTYNATTLYPVGNGGYYLAMWIDPTTTAGGPVVISGEAFNSNSGSLGSGATFLSANRWQSFVASGNSNFKSTNIQLTDTAAAFTTSTKILTSTSASGSYEGIIPTVQYAAGPPKTVRTAAQIATADFTGYFAYGELTPCTTPSDNPASFATTNLGNTSFDASFTAATSTPSAYLVVRYASAATPTAPTNNTTYAVAATLGTGTVVANTTGLTFSQTGLTANTTYDYYIYGYNNSSCFGPVYNTATPFMASVTTCATAVITPTVSAAVNITTSEFTARWSRNISSTANYLVDISTNNNFTSFLPGYQAFSTGTDTFTVVTGLNINTQYYYRVRTVDGGCWSSLSGSKPVTTLCNAITTFPYRESFSATLNTCALSTAGSNAYAKWGVATADGEHGAAGPQSGTHFLRLGVYTAQTTEGPYEYRLPPIDLGVTPKKLSYQYFLGNSGYTSSPVPLSISISNNGGTTWNTVYEHTTANSSFASSNDVSNWHYNAISLNAYSGTVLIKFSSMSNYGLNICDQGLDEIVIDNITAPVLLTSQASVTSQSSAIVGGNIISNGNDSVTLMGVVIGTAANPAIGDPMVIDSVKTPAIQTGSYNVNLSGLAVNTVYHYRSYAINNIGTSYGADSTLFIAPLIPTVNKAAPTNIGVFSVRIGGDIVSDGGSPVTASGVIYSTSSNNLIPGSSGVVDSTTSPLISSGTYNFNITGLAIATKYYFKAYATNSAGTSYSAMDSFTTLFAINTFPYSQDFEGGAANWTSTQIATANDWILGTPAKTFLNGAHSGVNAWATKLTGDYTTGTEAAVVSPILDFTSLPHDPVLKFYHKFKTEAGYDALVVEMSVDGGPWTRVDSAVGAGSNLNTTKSTNWYTNNSTSGPIDYAKFSSATNFIGSDALYNNHVNGWIQSITPLTGAANKSNVRVRFHFGADGFTNSEGWAIDDIEIIAPTTPIVTTGSLSNVTHLAARVGGNIIFNGGNPIIQSGVVYGVNPNPVLGGSAVDSATSPIVTWGGFAKDIAGLNPVTVYYYRAYAVNALGVSYGVDSTFTTKATPTAPVVTKTAATNITTGSAKIGGNITFDGGDAVFASGIVYSTNPNPERFVPNVVDSTTSPVVLNGGFTINAAGLDTNTIYYYRAYATNGIGTGYSQQDSFITGSIISIFPYTENFETGKRGWTTAAIVGTNDWALGTPTKTFLNGAHSGVNAWITNLTANYSNNSEAILVSPVYNFSALTSDPVLRFYHKFKTESDYDALVVEMSINNGPWKRLDSSIGTGTNFNTPNSYAWYSSNSTSGPIDRTKFTSTTSYVGTDVQYAGQNNGWIQSATMLTGAGGQTNAQFRFRFATDAVATSDGWAIDDIEIVASPASPGSLASAVTLPTITDTTTTVTWTNGNGDGRLVVARLANTTAVAPSDFRLYSTGSVFATPVDSTGLGNYVVYNGTGTTVTVTKLTKNTDYTYDVYEYNGKYMHVAFGANASNSGQTLPVKFTSFVAITKSNDVILNWSTASETNNKGFEIERSVDGRNFDKINFVKGAGNSYKTTNYNLLDKNVWLLSGVEVFYRLKQVDFNGKYTYSNIVRVEKNAKKVHSLSVYPNPFTEDYTITINATQNGASLIQMMDMKGRLVTEQSATVVQGSNTIEVNNLSGVQPGVYFVRITTNGETQVIKMIKQ
jgi:hypothetical protein